MKIVSIFFLALLLIPIRSATASDHAGLPNCAGLKDAAPAVGPLPRVAPSHILVMPEGEYLETRPLNGAGSMLPIADWGHGLIVKKVAWSDIRVNQFILFRPPDPSILPVGTDSVFHQVIGLGRDMEGPFAWTRGVASCTVDPWLVRPNALLGIVVGVWWGG